MVVGGKTQESECGKKFSRVKGSLAERSVWTKPSGARSGWRLGHPTNSLCCQKGKVKGELIDFVFTLYSNIFYSEKRRNQT